MAQIYRHEFVVPEDALDGNGHVNNIEYLRWMLDTAMLHAEVTGGTKAMIDAGGTWVVRTHHLEYLRPAFAGEHVCVLTWVVNFRRVQSLRRYKVIRLPDEEVLAEGETNWAFVDAQTGKLRSIPQEVIDAFEVLPD